MKVFMNVQGSMEWHLARRGIPTASNFDKILTPAKCAPSAQADDYICELIGDIFSEMFPERAESFTNRAIRWGEQCEAEARHWYSFERNVSVQQVGFCLTDDGRFGCSPDGLVGEDGGLELKCPQPRTHIKYLLKGELPVEYKPQVHGALIVTGRPWWDFMSYSPGMAPLLIRVTPDAFTAKLRAALDLFHVRFMEQLSKIQATGGAA